MSRAFRVSLYPSARPLCLPVLCLGPGTGEAEIVGPNLQMIVNSAASLENLKQWAVLRAGTRNVQHDNATRISTTRATIMQNRHLELTRIEEMARWR